MNPGGQNYIYIQLSWYDGLDMDWEYPGGRADSLGIPGVSKE